MIANPPIRQVFAGFLTLLVCSLTASSTDYAPAAFHSSPLTSPAEIPLTSGLAIEGVAQSARRAINVDSIIALIAQGELPAPVAGETIAPPTALRNAGEPKPWRAVSANAQGEFGDDARRGYLAFSVESDRPRVMMLVAQSHGMVYVAGEPRMGDPYATGYVRLPVALRAGQTPLLFALAGRGPFRGKLVEPRSAVELNPADITAPDLIVGEPGPRWLGAPIANATNNLQRITLTATCPGQPGPAGAVTITLPPLSVCKVALEFTPPAHLLTLPPGKPSGELEVALTATGQDGASDTATIKLALRTRDQTHKRTFVSAIDGGVQYLSIVPPSDSANPPAARTAPAFVLSLHGASVEAVSQANSYGAKPGLVIACPTNRRPFGFDWEDWGRTDALEAMAAASAAYGRDPARTYLTGHSMGGHGTWQLGVLLPHLFHAIGPSAGWLSFESYAATPTRLPGASDGDPRAAIFRRAGSSSLTQDMLANLRTRPVYILHGDADDNVPPSEARSAQEQLQKLGIEPAMHLQPGAGHWWEDPKPAAAASLGAFKAACMDWPPMFELFSTTRGAPVEALTRIQLTLNQPGPSAGPIAQPAPVVIEAQERFGLTSTVDVRGEAGEAGAGPGRLIGVTTNVTQLRIHPLLSAGRASIELDGQTIAIPPKPANEGLSLQRSGGRWSLGPGPGPAGVAPKSTARTGPFKRAFEDRFALVYSTGGTPEETAWSLAKARFDGEQWWVRGNGRAVLVSDKELLASPHAGNIVLYGNQATNLAWSAVLADSAVQVDRAGVTIAGRTVSGPDLAVLCVAPGKANRLVGIVGGTGLVGMRAADRLGYFSSGVGFPDVTVLRASTWREGLPGVELAGFWSNDWSAEGAELVWK